MKETVSGLKYAIISQLRRKEMKGQKPLRYLLVIVMLVVSIPIVAVGQLQKVIIDVSGMT